MNSQGDDTTPVILWHPPIWACTSMVTTSRWKDRYLRINLRATSLFHNKPGCVNVKVAVEYDSGVNIHFVKCFLFLKDSHEEYFVVLQWYDPVGREPYDSVSGLMQLVLRRSNVPKRYSVMPITSIVNGAVIIRSEDKLWVLLSPREARAYEQTNTSASTYLWTE
jgi:hypothetical protein